MSQIAKELRENGRKFSQTALMFDLTAFTPIFKEGKVIFYDDSVTEVLMKRYKVRTPVVEVQAPLVVEGDPDLVAIKRMLEAICKDLNIAVH